MQAGCHSKAQFAQSTRYIRQLNRQLFIDSSSRASSNMYKEGANIEQQMRAEQIYMYKEKYGWL